MFSGEFVIVSWSLAGMFLVGPFNRLRKRKRTKDNQSGTKPAKKNGKIPKIAGYPKRTNNKGQKISANIFLYRVFRELFGHR